MTSTPLQLLSAAEAARWIRAGKTSSEALVSACLKQIQEREDTVRAFQFLDPEHALAAARAADAERLEGGPIGPLHGVPVGIKDIIDTADMPTERGSALCAGRVPNTDATLVTRLRAAGAIILGKTVTTEFAVFGPGKTRNPHDPRRTPGGSSSGSAAAVAADMLPIAIGSQTNGSTIRPAAFCGVLGYKPTRGLISRHGVLTLSPSLDHVGLFARSVEDLALLAEVLSGFDERDPGSLRTARLPLLETAASEPPLPPRFAFVKTPHWSRADADTHAAWQDLRERLGARSVELEELELFPSALEAWRWHQTIMEAEMALHLDREWQTGAAQLSPTLRQQIERGRQVSAFDYQYALSRLEPMYASFAELFEQSYDAILTPAAFGAAPLGLESTGDPAFSTLWTLCGMPAVSLPLLETPEGLPLGVQVVGARRADGKLLRTARWLAGVVAAG
jgi:Asp-tRNA(Asn)/Glu-tRNA(Gln) amidotransferase A subunit family amidase